jgi:ABC-type uncharacterized transport system permease subunit
VKIEKTSVASPASRVFLTLLSILLALLTGLLFLKILKFDGLKVYQEMFRGAFFTQYCFA